VDDPGRHLIGELLGLIAHDLRNPLSAVQSNLSFLRTVGAVSDAEHREALDDGVLSCHALNHIIDNLDALAQSLRKGGVTSALGPDDLFDVVEEVLRRCQPTAQSYGVSLAMAEGSEPVVVDLDRDLTIRILDNLVRNCIQHAGAGRQVRVRVRTRAESPVVEVEDTGMAVAEGALAFSAEGQIRAKSRPGGRYSRGLGLYCAGLAAEASGWIVECERPRNGCGNRFVLVRASTAAP
jgi:signal transduction histidine kinase